MKVRSVVLPLLIAVLLFYAVPIHYVEKDLEVYINNFESLTKIYCPSTRLPNQFIVGFGDLSKEGWIGVCKINSLRSEIVIDREHWTTATEDDKISLVNHEASHCVLDKDHVDDPMNYMYFQYTKISKEVVIEQTIKNIKENCK